MKTQRLSLALVSLLLAVTPAWGVSKEIVQLQTQVQQLQDQMLRINSFTVEERTKESVEYLRRANRYWPNGRHPKAP